MKAKRPDSVLKFIMAILAMICQGLPASADSGSAMSTDRPFRNVHGSSDWDIVNQGVEYLKHNRLDSALVNFSYVAHKPVTGEYDDLQNHVVAYNGMGVVNYLTGNYAQSYMNFREAIARDSLYVDAYHNLASIHYFYGKHEEGRRILLKAYQVHMKKANHADAAYAFVNIVNYDIRHGLLPMSDTLVRSYARLDVETAPQDPIIDYAKALSLGAQALLDKKTGKALNHFHELVSISHRLDARLMSGAYFDLSKVYEQVGQMDSAASNLVRILALMEGEGHDDMSVEAGKTLADLYDRQGRHDEALLLRYHALKVADSLQVFSEFDKIRSFDLQSEVDRHRIEMAVAEAQNRTRTIVLIIVSAVTVLLAGMLAILLAQRRSMRLKDRKLYDRLSRDFREASVTIEGNASIIEKENDSVVSTSCTDDREAEEPRSYRNRIDDSRASRLEEEISKALAEGKDVLRQDFTLQMLADIVGDTPKNVSQIINERLGKNFNAAVNERRVNAAIGILNDPQYANYTVDAIAGMVGFKNRSTFSRVFTSATGITPTSFRNLQRDKTTN